MREFIDDFKKFMMRGNVLDLAVAVIIGAAFNQVVNSLVKNLIFPIIAAIGGKPNFNDLTVKVGKGVVLYGTFITDVVNFLIIAFTIFVIIKAVEKMQTLRRRAPEEDEETLTDEARILLEIRDELRAQRSTS